MNDYLADSYDDELCKKYGLRPGVGLAAPQVGVAKKMLVIMAYDEKGDFHHYVLVNPKIISTSVELTYLETGEGCLSVTKDYRGLIHRHKSWFCHGGGLRECEGCKRGYPRCAVCGGCGSVCA